MLISDASCGNKPSSSFIHVSLAMVALGRPWAHSKRGWSGLIAGKTDDGRRSCSGSVYCAEEGGRKRLTYICCVLYPRRVRFALGAFQMKWQNEGCRIPAVSGRVVYHGENDILYMCIYCLFYLL